MLVFSLSVLPAHTMSETDIASTSSSHLVTRVGPSLTSQTILHACMVKWSLVKFHREFYPCLVSICTHFIKVTCQCIFQRVHFIKVTCQCIFGCVHFIKVTCQCIFGRVHFIKVTCQCIFGRVHFIKVTCSVYLGVFISLK